MSSELYLAAEGENPEEEIDVGESLEEARQEFEAAYKQLEMGVRVEGEYGSDIGRYLKEAYSEITDHLDHVEGFLKIAADELEDDEVAEGYVEDHLSRADDSLNTATSEIIDTIQSVNHALQGFEGDLYNDPEDVIAAPANTFIEDAPVLLGDAIQSYGAVREELGEFDSEDLENNLPAGETDSPLQDSDGSTTSEIRADR